MGTKPRGKLNRRSEEIQVILDGFSRRGTDSNPHRIPVCLLVLSERTLDPSSAASRRHSRCETRHDAISGVLDLAAAPCSQGISDDRVMDVKNSHRRVVPEALRELRRAYDIREQNGPDSRVALVARAARNERGARTVHFTSAQESLCNLGRDFDNLLCDQAMRFTMHRGGRFRIRFDLRTA